MVALADAVGIVLVGGFCTLRFHARRQQVFALAVPKAIDLIAANDFQVSNESDLGSNGRILGRESDLRACRAKN